MSFDSWQQPPKPITVVVGTRITCYKILSSSKAHAGGLRTTRLELSPWPSKATVATWGHCLSANNACRLSFAGPRYTTDTRTGFRPYFQAWLLSPNCVHTLSDFR